MKSTQSLKETPLQGAVLSLDHHQWCPWIIIKGVLGSSSRVSLDHQCCPWIIIDSVLGSSALQGAIRLDAALPQQG
jgi:hypothetical protein